MNTQKELTNVKRETIFLAGLLHDIGKFWQRADKSFADKQNELSVFFKKMAESICPVNDQGRFGYQHVIWSNEFFEKVKNKLKNIPGVKDNLFAEDNSGENNLVNFAVNHHKPQTQLQAIVTLADWWSAGIDRTDTKTLEKPDDPNDKINWGKARYKSIPLYSVFNIVHTGNYNYAFPLKPLNVFNPENVFPSEINNANDGISEAKYAKLWEEFINDFAKLPEDSLKGFTESLLYLLKKYTWCIPSNTMDMANVSLYEHLKTTAAIADCLFEYGKEAPADFVWNESSKRLSLDNDAKPLMMVGGDISGIQKFIYNIASRKASMSLKGRSFYLQLLIDSIIQKIISHEDIDATLGHVIYSSGGKFYMLLPNIEKVKNALDDIRKEIEKELWEDHQGKLTVNMAFIPFAYQNNKVTFNDQSNADLGSLWKALEDKMSINKAQKFKSLLLNDFQKFFEPEKDGGNVKVCAVTGQNLRSNDCKILAKDDLSETIVSKQVYMQIELGQVLKDADFNITFKGKAEESSYLNKKAQDSVHVVGVANYLFDKKDLAKDDADFRTGISSVDVSRVRMINQTNFLAAPLKGSKVSYGFQFYGGNEQAMHLQDKSRYKTFEQMTEVVDGDENSETYFGILRMDVDGLGSIFIKGLDENQKSFSAFATMSFLLDMFFSGYLNYIRNDSKDSKGNFKYRHHVNILYSGGDDVFAVGRWDKVIDFAEEVRKDFRRFMGREDISLSAGLAIVNNKFPIAKAAQIAEVAEKKAKEYIGETEKNAFCFLGDTVSWKEEFDYVKDMKQKFVDLISQSNMSKSILHRLMLFDGIKKENESKQKDNPDFKPDLSYKWHTAYYLKRFIERYEKKDEVKSFIKGLQKDLFVYDKYNQIALAARWAELELKLNIS